MPTENTRSTYGSTAKLFHWLTALLILTLIPLGQYATYLADIVSAADGTPDQTLITRTTALFSIHKTLGIAVFFVALLRIMWALGQPKPGLLNGDKPAEAFLAELVHWLLYGSLVLVPLSGWVHHAATTGFAPIWWPFGQSLPFVPKDDSIAHLAGTLHYLLQWVLTVSVGLHIAGALKHHVIDQDATLRRMLPGYAEGQPTAKQPGHALPVLGALGIWVIVLVVAMTPAIQTDMDHREETIQSEEVTEQSSSDDVVEPTGSWSVQDGTLGLTVVQMGSDVAGQFTDWSASITYNDTPDADGRFGSVTVSTVIASLDLGSVTDQAKGPAYLDSAQFPEALFEAELIEDGGQMIARGTLSIKDHPMPVDLPFSLTIEGDRAEASGEMQINRLDFGIGTDVQDEGSLAHGVSIRFDLRAQRVQ